MDGLSAGDLQMSRARVGRLNLMSATIKGDLNLDRVKVAWPDEGEGSRLSAFVHGSLICERMYVGGVASLGGSFDTRIACSYSKIEEALSLQSGEFKDTVSFAGAQIGELRLGEEIHRAKWAEGSSLNLVNARASAIQDSSNAWPDKLNINGFTYRSLVGLTVYDSKMGMSDRSIEWLKGWLAKQDYAPGPYQQLASALRDIGRVSDADDILYTARDLERKAAPFWQKTWLTVVNLFIGYGFRVERSLYWSCGFLIMGILVMWISGEGARNGISKYGVAYSFDMLLPIIQLRKKHYDIDLNGWPRCYFYVHKVMGYVLASFLITGLSGLAKG